MKFIDWHAPTEQVIGPVLSSFIACPLCKR